MQKNDVLYIIIPAYNETENIRSVVKEWYEVIRSHDGGGKSRLVVIDDGSKDDTYAVIKQLAAVRPLMVPLTKKNTGHGGTILYGYRYAIENDADYIFQTDSDGQTSAAEFEPFWKKRKGYDMVIGWRRSREDGMSRVLVTNTLRLVLRVIFGVWIRDANTPYRLMKAETLRRYIDLIPKDFNLSNVLLTVVYTKKGCAIKYIPITFRPRQGGVNSINMKKIFKIGRQALSDFRDINRAL